VTSRNDITGDALRTRTSTAAFNRNFDLIDWGNKADVDEPLPTSDQPAEPTPAEATN
jgi:hypothetical protein